MTQNPALPPREQEKEAIEIALRALRKASGNGKRIARLKARMAFLFAQDEHEAAEEWLRIADNMDKSNDPKMWDVAKAIRRDVDTKP
jgi:predicted DNA-binding transcriptional regulator YafY